ncbi:MAG TPA: phosphoribosyltransferase family protein [Usitatibacter sp.]|nr:phosphoribosyltransferase family protein [Usitatibacter sp.]
MPFRDRIDAARQLAAELQRYAPDHPVVLAVPRGSVPMGETIARELGGDLDVVLVRKLRAPFNPEFAVGSIDEGGWSYIADYAAGAGADEAYLEREKREQLEILQRRRASYTPGRKPLPLEGRVAIVVDDGLATGATMVAALHSVAARKPRKLVCAVPVASREALGKIAPYADEIVCLETPEDFHAVGQFYEDFPQLGDAEVAQILRAGTRPTLEPSA